MFFHYRQNNSGGSFDVGEEIGHHVVVEAKSAEEADDRAETVGLYFDGVSDCSCCGNRWHTQWSGKMGDEVPSKYGEPVETYESFFKGMSEVTHVYFLDGRHDIYIDNKLVTAKELREELDRDGNRIW